MPQHAIIFTRTDTPAAERCDLALRDVLLLATFAGLLFAVTLVGGRPLSLHEAVLPQSAREMLADGDWLVPKSGGRPWLESPPLPQWITVAVAWLAGGADRVWVVRLPSVLIATATVLILAQVAARWYGRTIGLLAGCVMATTQEFVRYAWSAEDEIHLCFWCTAAMACLVHCEWPASNSSAADHRAKPHPLGGQSWATWGFFLTLGFTNQVKGIGFGLVLTMAPILVWLSRAGTGRWRPYVRLAGLFLVVALAAAWPVAVSRRYPDAFQVWSFDQVGRVGGHYATITQPTWYYLARLPEILAPWIVVIPWGLALTARTAWRYTASPERFLWCWAFVPLLVLSIPSGKHHHYLLPVIGPWAILAALALAQLPNCWQHIAWLSRWNGAARPRMAAAMLMAIVACGYLTAHLVAGKYFDRSRFDAKFLQQANRLVPAEAPLLVNAGMGQLRAFQTLYYLDPRARTLHNLTFLRDEKLAAPDIFLVTFASDASELALYGRAEPVLTSPLSWRTGRKGDCLTLFRLRLDPGLVRESADVRISPLQAMRYAPGPFLGRRR